MPLKQRSLLVIFVGIGCAVSQDSPRLERVPLAELYATHPNNDMKKLTLGDDLPFQDHLDRFLQLRPRASNLFLARASTVTTALEAAVRFEGDEQVILPKEGEDSKVWVIVFFGFSSSAPQAWSVEAVERDRSTIRVTFATPTKFSQRTTDFDPYLVLIPLKAIEPGPYRLELKHSQSKEVVLARKVSVRTKAR